MPRASFVDDVLGSTASPLSTRPQTVSGGQFYAKVFASLPPDSTDWVGITTTDPSVVQGYEDDTDSGVILFACVPCAEAGPSTGALNYLAVWALWPPATSGNPPIVDGPAVATFYGISACCTECEVGSGGGSNNNDVADLRGAGASFAHNRGPCNRPTKGDPAAASLIPQVWNLSVKLMPTGSGNLDGYNGDYQLTLSDVELTPSGLTKWTFPGSATKPTKLELSCATFKPRKFTLTFTRGGSTAIEYTRTSVGWSSLTANLMFLTNPKPPTPPLNPAPLPTVVVIPG